MTLYFSKLRQKNHVTVKAMKPNLFVLTKVAF